MRYRQGTTKPLPGARVNWGHPLAESLIGCWNFNEGSGARAFDATGKYGDGNLLATTGKPTWERGQHGIQIGFTAANNQYVEVANNPSYPLSSGPNGGYDDRRNHFTYQIKFYLNSLRNYNGLFTKNSAGLARPFDNYVLSDGTLKIKIGTVGDQTVTTLAAGVWYDMVVVQSYDPQFTYPYIGAEVYLGSGTRYVINSGAIDWVADSGVIRFGNRADDITALDGKILYARLWSRSLPASEIHALYAEPYCFMASPSPVARFSVAATGGASKAYYYAQTQGLR